MLLRGAPAASSRRTFPCPKPMLLPHRCFMPCRCSCSPITPPPSWAPMSTSHATWRNRSLWNKGTGEQERFASSLDLDVGSNLGGASRKDWGTGNGRMARDLARIRARDRARDLTRHWARQCRLARLAPVIAGLGLALCALSTSAAAAGKPGEEGAAQAEAGEAGKPAGPAAAKKKHDPAEAQRAVEHAGKLIEGGKTDQAIQVLSATLAAGNLPPAIMAKALLLRGIAYRQQKKPAQAISDFTSALWLKGGLSDSDRADGQRQRSAAYAEAGLAQTGEASPVAASKETRSKERTASPASPAPWSDGTTSAPQTTALNQEPSAPPATGGGWNLFGNLFSGGAGSAWATQAAAPAAPAASAPAAAAAPPAPAAPAPPRRDTADLLKIGRASCRERVQISG